MGDVIFKATVSLKELKTGLKHVKAAARRSSSIPTVGAVRFVTQPDNGLSITCGNGDEWLTWRCAGAVVEPAGQDAGPNPVRVAVDAAKLYAAVSKIKGEKTVDIEAHSDGPMQVKCGRVVFKFEVNPNSVDWLEKPSAPADTAYASMIHADIVAALASVRPFVSKDDTRPNLSGVLFAKSGENIRLVASDGHTLGVLDIDIPASTLTQDHIVPDTALAIVPKAKEGAVKFGFFSKQKGTKLVRNRETDKTEEQPFMIHYFTMRGKQWELIAQTTEGTTFPDYAQVIPSRAEGKVVFDAGDMVECIDQLLPMTTDRSRRGRFTTGPEGLSMSVHALDVGEAYAEPFGTVSGPVISWGQNITYVKRAMQALAGKDKAMPITATYTDDLGPILYTRPDGKMKVAVMPLRN